MVLVGIMRRVFDINTGIINNLIELIPASNLPTTCLWAAITSACCISLGRLAGHGWGSIIYMAALSSVDPELHEAATIDGASRHAGALHRPAHHRATIITLILQGSLMSIGFDKAFLMQK